MQNRQASRRLVEIKENQRVGGIVNSRWSPSTGGLPETPSLVVLSLVAFAYYNF